MKIRDIDDIDSIVLHCSDSGWGDAEVIDEWHRNREPVPFDMIGYNFVILNGFLKNSETYYAEHDGEIEDGRPMEYWTAQCQGMNHRSIGICLIGINEFTPNQYGVLLNLLEDLCLEYDIEPDRIYGHNEFSDKECPSFNVQDIRDIMKVRL